jgi:transposase InsO family protein
MTTRELKKLNKYPEFESSSDIDGIIEFIASGYNDYPERLITQRQRDRYFEKFGSESHFEVRNVNGAPTLFYHPVAQIDLEVARPSQRERETKMQQIYADPARGLGVGLGQFFHQVAMSYLNIPKKATDEFLKRQGDYTVTRLPRKQVNAPIVAKSPNERWGIDFIDLRPYIPADLTEWTQQGPQRRTRNPVWNRHPKWCLTVVDHFSGKAFGKAMPNKKMPTVVDRLQQICSENGDTYPHIIQADNEFQTVALKRWCDEHNVQLIKTSPYMPTSNGKVERMNREIRKKIRAGFVRNNNLEWADMLPVYIDNINRQQSTKSHVTPNELWVPGYNPPRARAAPNRDQGRPSSWLRDGMTTQQRLEYGQDYQIWRARKMLAQGRSPTLFQVGDLVRINLLALSERMRELKEEGRVNKLAVHYTPEVYRIVGVLLAPPNATTRTRYTIQDANTGTVVMRRQQPRLFFASELILQEPVRAGTGPNRRQFVQTSITPADMQRALQLNLI